MKSLNEKITVATLGLMSMVPTVAAAETTTGDVNGSAGLNPVVVTNTDSLTIGNILTTIILWVLGFSAAVAVLFLIIGGLQYITASGNEKRAEAAKSTILYAVIGLVVILLSFVIVGVIKANVGGIVSSIG